MTKLMFCLMFLCAAYLDAQTPQGPHTLHGTLTYNQKPIAQATVFLQSLKNEGCAVLFNRSILLRNDERALKHLQKCIRDEGSITVDGQGQYQFAPKRPGWYCLHFLWDIQPKPAHLSSFRVSSWNVLFAGQKDLTGKYDAMAQGMPVFFAATQDLVQDFAYDGPLDQPTSTTARISVPGVRGMLQLEVGPTAWQSWVRADGKETQMNAMGRVDTLLISAFIQKVGFPATPDQCRKDWWPRAAKSSPMERLDIREYERAGIAVVDYIVPRFGGHEVRQKSLHAYLGTGNICAEVHLSKTQYTAKDERLFEDVLSTIRLSPDDFADESGSEIKGSSR